MADENNIGEQPDVDMIQMALERNNPAVNQEPSGSGNEQAGQTDASQQQEPQTSTDQPPSAEGGQPPVGQSANDGNKGIDQIELAKTVASAVAAVNAEQNKAQQEKKPELTIEEANRILGKISITPEETRKIFSSETPEEERAAMLTDLLIRTAMYGRNMATTIANAELNKYAGRIDNFFAQNIQPVLSQVSQKAAHEAETKFYEDYPGLIPYKSVVNVMTASIAQQNPKLLQVPEKQFKETLVNEISKVIKQSIPNFDPKVKLDNGGAVANPVQQNATTSVPKATTRTFSSGGVINKPNETVKDNVSAGFSIFGY
jgi:hypothetical protein